ncbi:MAG TPA: hypothetical protein VF388_00765, partial [Lacunisphaera sp.]
MLTPFFQWLDVHPASYWVLVAAATFPLVARLGRLIGHEARPATGQAPAVSWTDALLLFLLLLAWRWPFLLVAYDYNPDESQMIAGAMTLGRDPVFWRAVDGGSSGPLNYYLLLPWHWVGAPLDYFIARLTCLFLTWGALLASLQVLTRAFGRTVAWLGILPAAAFFATVVQPELTNLSTEQVPVLLVAIAFYLLAGRAPADHRRLWAAGAVAGALPWSKLQSAPIALALLAWAWWQALREPGLTPRARGRTSVQLLLAAATPTLLFAGLAVMTGQADAVWRRFFLQNFAYAATDNASFAGEGLRGLWQNAWADGSFPLFLAIVGTGWLTTALVLVHRRMRPSALWVAGGVIALAAFTAVIAPRRDYLHYVLLLPIPFTLWYGAALGGWWQQLPGGRARLALGSVSLLAGLLPLSVRSWQGHAPIYGGFTHHWRYPRSSVAAVVHALAARHDTLAIWGWACSLHVETALPQATRDGTTLWSIEDNPQQAYHRAAYLADLQRARPAVFVDAVGPGAFVFTDRRQAHENFPALADFIRQYYTLVMEEPDARVYARKELPTLRGMNPERLHQLIMQGRDPEKFLMSMTPVMLDPLQRKFIGPRRVVLLPASTVIEWPLDPAAGEVSLEFGCEFAVGPDGGQRGTIILEVVSPTATDPVFKRALNPSQVPGDRGLQGGRVVLPRIAPAAKLRLEVENEPER